MPSGTAHASIVSSNNLSEMKQTYRTLDAKAQVIRNDPAQMLRLQKRKIDKMKSDNFRLQTDLALETRSAMQSIKSSRGGGIGEINKMQDQIVLYQRKIQREKEQVFDLNHKIGDLKKKYLGCRRTSVEAAAEATKDEGYERNVALFENKLGIALVKFNEARSDNKRMRALIENLRRERQVNDAIFDKMQGELDEKRRVMNELVERTNAAHEKRIESQKDMLAVRERAAREQSKFQGDWKGMVELMEQTKSEQKELLAGKVSKLLESGDELRANRAKLGDASEEGLLRQRCANATYRSSRAKADLQEVQAGVEAFEGAFTKIQHATGIEDIEKLVKAFDDAEQENFALFNQSNDLNNEMERLEDDAGRLEAQLKQLESGSSTESGEGNNRRRILSNLEERNGAAEAETATFTKKHQRALGTVKSLGEAMEDLLHLVADREALESFKVSGMNQDSMLQYLTVIESRLNELSQRYMAQAEAAAAKRSKTVSRKSSAELLPEPLVTSEDLEDTQALEAQLGVGIGSSAMDPYDIVLPSTTMVRELEIDEEHEEDFGDATSPRVSM